MNYWFKSKNEHCVIVDFLYCYEELDALYELEKQLRKIIDDANVGIYDGHEISLDNDDASLYMYGENAERLFKEVYPVLKECDFMKGAVAFLRFGASIKNSSSIEVEIK